MNLSRKSRSIPTTQEKTSAYNRRPTWLTALLCVVIAACLMASMLRVAYDRHLVRAIAPQEWGRYLYGIGAAITQTKFGIGGFAIYERVEAALLEGGLTDTPRLLKALGYQFPANLADGKLLNADIRNVLSAEIPPPPGGFRFLKGSNGDDTGIATYVELAFRVFHTRIVALTYLYFAILGASIIFFTFAHGRSPASMIAMVTVVLAIYLTECSAFVNATITFPLEYNGIPGLDIKDPRFLSTLAAIPVLHVLVGWFRPRYRMRLLAYAMLAGQSAIFALVLHIRSPAEWAVLAIAAAWAFVAVWPALRTHTVRSLLLNWTRADSLPAMGLVFSILVAGHMIVAAKTNPAFAATGDITQHTFWHGVLYGLQVNPEWDRRYAAKFRYADGDAMPVVAAKQEIMKLPPGERGKYLTPYGAPNRVGLEKFSRAALLHLARKDPAFVARTLLIVKPRWIVRTALGFYRSIGWAISAVDMAIIGATLLILVYLARDDDAVPHIFPPLLRTGIVCLLLAWIPNWLVAANEMVMVDNFVWTLFSLCLFAVMAGVALARPALFDRAGEGVDRMRAGSRRRAAASRFQRQGAYVTKASLADIESN